MKWLEFKKKAWLFFEDPMSSLWARVYLLCFISLTLLSVILVSLDSVSSVNLRARIALVEVEYMIYAVFSVDLIMRAVCAPILRAFCFNFYNIIDFLSLLPFYICLGVDCADTSFLFLIYLLRPVVRLLTLSRNFFGFKLLVKSLTKSAESLTIPLFLLFLMVVSGGILVYYFEHSSNVLVDSIPQGMYLAVATISTVGFGDVYPITVAGKITVCVMIISGVLYMAMPLAIVGSNFLEVWEDRDRILLVARVRDRLVQFGYSPDDLIRAFRNFDSDLDGDIGIDEFSNFIKSLGLGLSHERIVDLFMSFDSDENGQLRLAEFARALFPNHVWTDDELRAKEVELYSVGNRSKHTVRSEEHDSTDSVVGFVDNAEGAVKEIVGSDGVLIVEKQSKLTIVDKIGKLDSRNDDELSEDSSDDNHLVSIAEMQKQIRELNEKVNLLLRDRG